MNCRLFGSCLAIALMMQTGINTRAAEPAELDLQAAIPADAYLAVYGQHNPERDYQREYYQQVWQTVKDTEILERALKIFTERAPANDLDKARAVLDELRNAAAPIDWDAIVNSQEVAYAQIFQLPTSHHLMLLHLTPDGASGLEQGLKNLFGKVEQFSNGKAWVEGSQQDSATVTSLRLPPQAPISPTVIRHDDIILLSTSRDIALRSFSMLKDGSSQSKFQDPRLKEALAQLPEPEDSLVFYDGKLQMQQMRQFAPFIRQNAQGEHAERVVEMIERVLDQVAIFDYEVTVQYTNGNQNCSAAYGKFLPNIDEKVLTKAIGSSEPFTNWASWVPAEAHSYSLSRGISLHPIYEWITQTVREEIPEAQPQLDKWEELQNTWGVHIDRDILQSFSGESVSVSMPAASPNVVGGQESVTAVRCHNPDRIRELLHQLFDKVSQHPVAKAQQLQIKPVEQLEGFEEISALPMAMFGARPAVGFRDGWMFLGSSPDAVQKVLATRAGEQETIEQTEAFRQFGLEVTGPVSSIAYTDLAAQLQRISQGLNQAGMIAPAIVGLMGIKADAQEMAVVQDILGLLPSVGQIVSKFDFLQAKLAVTQPGTTPGTYMKRTVVLVRPPASE